MITNIQDLKTKIILFQGRLNALKSSTENFVEYNRKVRILHAEIELLHIDIEESLQKLNESEVNGSEQLLDNLDERISLMKELDTLSDQLKLKHSTREKFSPQRIVYDIIRLFSSASFLFWTALFLSIPLTLFKPIDVYLIRNKYLSPTSSINCWFKRYINQTVLKVTGIELISENQVDFLAHACYLMCFSHGSSLDVFTIASATPVSQVSLGKWDLFFVPYFSWLLIAFGAYPVDRKNLDQAVKALHTATNTAIQDGCCEAIAISPEGTRSKSGLLLKFKKGPFHLWEDAQLPIIPIVVIGAYELYPPGKIFITPGKVYIRFLDIILPNTASSRDDMSRIVRRQMLQSCFNAPIDAGASPSKASETETWLYIVKTFIINYYCIKAFNFIFYKALGFKTISEVMIVFLTLSVIITVGWYYIVQINVLSFRGKLTRSSSLESGNTSPLVDSSSQSKPNNKQE